MLHWLLFFQSCLFLWKIIMEDDSKLTLIQKQMGNERNMTQKYQRRKTVPWLSHFPARKFCTNTAGRGESSGYQLWISIPGANYSARGLAFIKNRRLNGPFSCLISQSSFSKWLSSCALLQVTQMSGTNCTLLSNSCPCCSCTSWPVTHVFLRLPTGRRIDLGPPSLQAKPATAPELNIGPLEPPQLNGSGSISKAAVQSVECNSISCSALMEVCVWGGGGNLTAELQWRASNIMSLTCSMKQHVPVEHKRHTGRRWQITQQCWV